MTLAGHTMVAYLFATIIGEDDAKADAAHGQLCAAWTRFADAFRLSPLPGRVDQDPPAQRPDIPQSALLAGRRGPTEDGLREMWCNQIHDTLCLSVVCTGPGWADLDADWAVAVDGLSLHQLLGMTRVFSAATDQPDPVGLDDHAAAVVLAQLPGVPPALGWEAAASTTGLAFYRIRGSDLDPDRDLVVLAPGTDESDRDLGTWIWRTGLGRLGMYELHAAKLRYQARIVRQDRPRIAQLRRDTQHRLAALQPLLDHPAALPTATLQRARHEVARLQAQASGLIDTTARLAIIRRTVAVAAANMDELARAVIDPGQRGLFDHDQRLARRLDLDLDDEHTYLTANTRRAEHFADLAAQALDTHRDQTRQAEQHRENQFTLFQTAVIGAVLMALTAVQAFGYRINLNQRAQPAVIATLGALAFTLYTISMRRAERTRRPHQHASLLIRTLVSIAVGALAAAITWTITALSSLPAMWHARGITVTALSAGAFLLGAFATFLTGASGPPEQP
jgi:hypothetical protein